MVTFYIIDLTIKKTNCKCVCIKNELKVQVEREKNPMEVQKEEDNEWTSMSSSLLITSYFVLHTLPSFQPSKHQFFFQATP
jgi:hypothetical protein